jgi:hypothetical protein
VLEEEEEEAPDMSEEEEEPPVGIEEEDLPPISPPSRPSQRRSGVAAMAGAFHLVARGRSGGLEGEANLP